MLGTIIRIISAISIYHGFQDCQKEKKKKKKHHFFPITLIRSRPITFMPEDFCSPNKKGSFQLSKELAKPNGFGDIYAKNYCLSPIFYF